MKIKACLFDLDGVIIDTAIYHYRAWKRLAKELGFDLDEEDNQRLKGIDRMRSLEIILELGGIYLDEEKKMLLANKKNQWYLEDVMNLTPYDTFPGVLDFISTLKKNGIKTGLGSASKNALTILERIKMTSYFDVIIDGNQVTMFKPDPEVFLKGAKALNTSPAACLVFEDSKVGIDAAKSAGMHSVGIGSADKLKKADFVISSFKEMSMERLNFSKPTYSILHQKF